MGILRHCTFFNAPPPPPLPPIPEGPSHASKGGFCPCFPPFSISRRRLLLCSPPDPFSLGRVQFPISTTYCSDGGSRMKWVSLSSFSLLDLYSPQVGVGGWLAPSPARPALPFSLPCLDNDDNRRGPVGVGILYNSRDPW